MSNETVHLDISIQIDTQAVVDTGITVADWNAMTDEQRSEIAQSAWSDMAEQDNGGMFVVTEGAEGV
jgi:hypothetical protein